MYTQTFIQKLRTNPDKSLNFLLPDQSVIRGDLHITEIKHQSIESVDCGDNSHTFNETVMQLWTDGNQNTLSDWTANKAVKIIDIVGTKRDFDGNAEIFIVFGDSYHPAAKYSIGEIRMTDKTLNVIMKNVPAVCKPNVFAKELASCC